MRIQCVPPPVVDLGHAPTIRPAVSAYLRYTDDFLLFGDNKAQLWNLNAVVKEELTRVRLRLAVPKSRLLAIGEGVPFCGFRFLRGQGPRILGATKRRFERRRNGLHRQGVRGADLTARVYGWYQFSREANSEGLRRAWAKPR